MNMGTGWVSQTTTRYLAIVKLNLQSCVQHVYISRVWLYKTRHPFPAGQISVYVTRTSAEKGNCTSLCWSTAGKRGMYRSLNSVADLCIRAGGRSVIRPIAVNSQRPQIRSLQL